VYIIAVLLFSATLVHLNNGTTSMIAYADDDNDDDHKMKNRSTIKDISDQVTSSGVGMDKEQVQQLLQLIQTQIVQTSGQDKATDAIKQIKSVLELNPNGPLAQSLLYLAKQQAIGNVNSVNEVTTQVAVHVANGNEDIGQIIKQAASHTQQVLSSQAPSSSPLSSPPPPPPSLQLSSPQRSLSLLQPQSSPPPSPTSQVQLSQATDNNNPPIANAGHEPAQKTVNAGAIVTLDGSASRDPDGDALTYTWTQISGPNVVLSTPANQPSSSPTTSFTAPNSQANLVFRLTVTDTAGLSDGDTVTIQVIPTPTPTPTPEPTPNPTPTPTPTPEPTPPPTTNVPPVANAGHEPAQKTVNAGAIVTLDGSQSYDPDGGTITSYRWSQVSGPTVALSGADTMVARFTAPNLAADTELVFRLIVTDNNNAPGSDEIHILVKHAPTQTGSPPTAVVGQDQVVNESQIVTLDGSQSHDPDGDQLTYLWTQQNSGPQVTLSDPTKAITTFRAPSNLDADATLFFQLKVTDKDGSDMAVQKVTVKRSTSPSVPPLPPDGRPQPEKGANQDPNTWRVVPMTDDPTKFKVVDDQGIKVADQFLSQATAQQYIDHYKAIFVSPGPGPGPGPGNGTTTEQIYTPKPGGRVFTKMNENGGQCKSDGIRFNLANEHTLVDRESTWIFTLNNDPRTCTDKPWWSPKVGSHGSSGEGSGLYECSVPWSGGFKSCRTEGPHPSYHSCSGYQHGNVPPMPKGKPVGIKFAQWRIPNGVHIEFWYDFTGGGKGPWIKYASMDDTLPGHCNGGSIKGPIGMNGELIGPAKAQDTMRMNGGDATYITGSIVELAPGQTPKGSIDTSVSTSSLSSATDENSSAAGPHPIVKESLFNKGLNDGEKDAKEVASTSSAKSDQKTMAAPSTTTPDDVDCESPDNLSGQDSIDYCKGYEQGFTEQNNLMAEK
jgi:REJ domain